MALIMLINFHFLLNFPSFFLDDTSDDEIINVCVFVCVCVCVCVCVHALAE